METKFTKGEWSVEKSCKECEHSHNGVGATGAMPVMEAVFNRVKKLFKR